MFLFILLLLIHSVHNESTDVSVDNKDSETEATEKKYIQDLTNKSVGYLPIAEILKRVNLSHITTEAELHRDTHNESTTARQELVTSQIQQNIIKVLLTGTEEDVLQIPYKTIMANLKVIDTAMLSENKKAIIWDLITNNVPVEIMGPDFLQNINGLWHDMPENELIKFNIKRWDILNYFGTSKFLKRRHAAILAYMIKRTYGPVLDEAEYINKVKGLICGFPETDLSKISSSVFKNIQPVVFQSLWPCTLEQVQVLLNNAKRPDTYGPLEVWTKQIFEKLGLVVTVINPYEFRKFNEEVFQGLNITILDLLSNEQLAQFTENQVANLNEKVMMSYNLRINNFRKLVQENEESGSNTVNINYFLCFVINIIFIFLS